uniref:Uncharacterized protein n=1 Tax=Rhizophora mucronata TaxID=61149 RepID=A0A2P2QDP9_RHIMU
MSLMDTKSKIQSGKKAMWRRKLWKNTMWQWGSTRRKWCWMVLKKGYHCLKCGMCLYFHR